MLTNEKIKNIAMQQSAYDAGCNAEDFMKTENMIVESVQNARARKYLQLPLPCNLISYGNNIVASIQPEYAIIVNDYISKYAVEHCFETPNMHVLDDAFQHYDKRICFMAEYFLPDVNCLQELSCQYKIRLLSQEDFKDLYVPLWSNALSKDRKHLDVIGIGAYDEDSLWRLPVHRPIAQQCGRLV